MGGGDDAAPQTRRAQSHRLVQGSRDDGWRDARAARPRHGRGLRIDGEHRGLTRRVRRPGGTPRAGVGAEGAGRPGQAHPAPRLRRPHARRSGRLRHLPRPSAQGERAAGRLPAQLHQSLPGGGPEDDRARAAPAARLGAPRLDSRAGRQPREHGRVREGATRSARVGTHPAGAAARCGAGGRRGAVRAELRRRVRAPAPRRGAHRRHRDQHRQPGVLRPGGDGDPRDGRRGHRGERRGDPRGEGGGGRLRRRVRAGECRERGPDAITRYHSGTPPPPPHANPPIEIEARVAEIARVLSARG